MSDWETDGEDWGTVSGSVPQERDSQPSVLIVDDDRGVRALLGYAFHDSGFVVEEAADGAEALSILADRSPDVMILDLMMPKVDGHGVLRELRERGGLPDCRIVVLTARSDASDAAWCWRLGADEYLNKPVEMDDLLRSVQALLRSSPEELAERRRIGLAEAERMDAIEAAFDARRRRR